MQLDGRVDHQAHTENKPQNPHDEKYPSFPYLLPHLFVAIALYAQFQLDIDPCLAEFALNFVGCPLSQSLLTEDLHLQPLAETALVDESHASSAVTWGDEFVRGGGVGAETDAALPDAAGGETGKGEGILGPVQVTQLALGLHLGQHYAYLYGDSSGKQEQLIRLTILPLLPSKWGSRLMIESIEGILGYFDQVAVHSYSNYNRMDEEGTITLQDRLGMMKAISFSENRETLLKQKTFFHWISLVKSKRQHAVEYYRMVLYVKGFKGIMEFVLSSRETQMKQEEERQRKMLQIEEQIKGKAKSLELMRKRWDFRAFKRVVKGDIRQNHEKERVERERAERGKMQEQSRMVVMNLRYNKTEFPIRNRDVSPVQRTNLDRTAQDLMENSRRSMMSQGMASQESFKRKFVPIKSLPPKAISTVSTRKDQQPQIKQSEKQIRQQEQLKLQSQKTIPPMPQQKPPSILPKVPQNNRQQHSQPQVSKLRQQILGLLSEIKMIEVNSLTQMVQQYGRAFKGQASITQKHLIREGVKLLSRISLIQ